MTLSKTKIPLILLITVFLVSCADRPGGKEYREITKIPIANEDEVKAKFTSYPIEKQLDIYLFSQCCVEGNSYPLMWLLTNDGEEKNMIPHIVKRIDESNDPTGKNNLINTIDKANLMDPLELIDIKCKCIADSPGVIDILTKNERLIDEQESDGIKGFKRIYSERLQRIKNRKQSM